MSIETYLWVFGSISIMCLIGIVNWFLLSYLPLAGLLKLQSNKYIVTNEMHKKEKLFVIKFKLFNIWWQFRESYYDSECLKCGYGVSDSQMIIRPHFKTKEEIDPYIQYIKGVDPTERYRVK